MDTKEVMDCFINPNKSSILFLLQQKKACTAKEIMELKPDIPQATLYRTLKQLTKVGIIKVVAERKVRAVVEKTYALNEAFGPDVQTIITENNGAGYLQLFHSFMMSLLSEFKSYAERETIDILHDGSGFSASPIYVNEAELQELAIKMNELIRPYQTRSENPEANQKLHTMAVVFTPPEE